jgi:hypothetical protein
VNTANSSNKSEEGHSEGTYPYVHEFPAWLALGEQSTGLTSMVTVASKAYLRITLGRSNLEIKPEGELRFMSPKL